MNGSNAIKFILNLLSFLVKRHFFFEFVKELRIFQKAEWYLLMADNDHHRRDKKHKHKHKHKRKHKSGDYESDDSHDKRRRKYETETAEEYQPKNIKRDTHYDCDDGRDYDNKQNNRGGDDEAELQESEEIPDYDFDWEQHRYTLNQIFFTDDDYIKR